MKWLILAYFIFAPVYVSAAPEMPANGPLVGQWVYYKKIFRGVEMPQSPEDPIHLHFDFTQEGESHLYWWNDQAEDHCERKGAYSVQENLILDKITWVNPKNSVSCSSDPDMQIGRETKTPFALKNGELFLEFHLGNDPLYYVWKKIDNRRIE